MSPPCAPMSPLGSRWNSGRTCCRDVANVSTATSVLGRPVTTPVVVSPTAMQRLMHPEGELATARAAAGAGTVFIVSMTATTSLEAVAAEIPEGRRWLQLYMQTDRGLTAELCRRAAAAGYEALCVTVDAPVVSRLRRFVGGVFAVPPDLPLPNLDVADPGREDRALGKLVAGFDAAVTFDDLGSFREWSGLPVVVKGVIRGDDARRCIDSGASAVSVSNHGGRQLGHCVATARALPWVVDAVDGQGEVYVDGGIRSGTDIVKALALGAQAVLVGRPILWGLASGGEEGVRAGHRGVDGPARPRPGLLRRVPPARREAGPSRSRAADRGAWPMTSKGPLVIGLMYPEDYEARPRQELDDDLAQLRAIDPAIEITEVRFVDSYELRTQRGASPGADLRHLSPPLTPAQRETFSRVEVVLALDLPFDVATVAPNLRWVQGLGAGVSQLLSAGLGEAGIRLTSAAGVNGVSISEFVVARLLQIWKRLPEIDASQGRHLWEPAYGKEVAGSTLGVVGMGGSVARSPGAVTGSA